MGEGQPQGLALILHARADPVPGAPGGLRRQRVCLPMPGEACRPGQVAEAAAWLGMALEDITLAELVLDRVSPGGATWHCDFVALSVGERTLYLPCATGFGVDLAARLLPSWRNPRADCLLYSVQVDGWPPPPHHPLIRLAGSGQAPDQAGWRRLAGREAKLQLYPLGQPMRVDLRLGPGQASRPWYLGSIAVGVPTRRQTFRAPAHCWLAGGDGVHSFRAVPEDELLCCCLELRLSAAASMAGVRPYIGWRGPARGPATAGARGGSPDTPDPAGAGKLYLAAPDEEAWARGCTSCTLWLPRHGLPDPQALVFGLEGLDSGECVVLHSAALRFPSKHAKHKVRGAWAGRCERRGGSAPARVGTSLPRAWSLAVMPLWSRAWGAPQAHSAQPTTFTLYRFGTLTPKPCWAPNATRLQISSSCPAARIVAVHTR